MNVIFLDIDGVLNGYNPRVDLFWSVLRKLHIKNIICIFYDRMGIRFFKLILLKILIRKTNAKIVLSSSLRRQWKLPYKQCGSTIKSLKRKCKILNINIFDITPKLYGFDRGDEIKEWLKTNNVKNFVIFDDELFNFDKYYKNNLILTSKDGIIKGLSSEDTGLKIKHIIKAIKLLSN